MSLGNLRLVLVIPQTSAYTG